MASRQDVHSYYIGIICALPEELTAMTAMLDHTYTDVDDIIRQDGNAYTFGSIGKNNVVVTCLPAGVYGTTEAARTTDKMICSFPNVEYGLVLMVGICGGVWSESNDVRLGDVVVSQPTGRNGGVVAYDYGKIDKDGQFVPTGALSKPPRSVLTTLQKLRADTNLHGSGLPMHVSNMFSKHKHLARDFCRPSAEDDRLFQWHYRHQSGPTCDKCDFSLVQKRPHRPDPDAIQVWYGTIASANKVMKHAADRDRIAQREGVIAFEMEAAGLMDTCCALVVRGVCDYADSHKNDRWHNFAAVAAAAFAKELLLKYRTREIPGERVRIATAYDKTPVTSRRQSVAQEVERASDNSHQWLSKTQARVQAKLQGKEPEMDLPQFLEKFQRQLFVANSVDNRAEPSDPVKGTCEWIVRNEKCQLWLNAKSGMLWVVGEADQGITNMSRFFFQRLKEAVGSNTEVVYYCCNDGEEKRNTAISMLRSSLWQIVDSIKGSGQIEAQESLRRHVESARSRAHDFSNNREALWKVILALASEPAIGAIYCVLDGLDELNDDSVQWLMKQYRLLPSARTNGQATELKVVIVSQEVKELRELTNECLCAEISLGDAENKGYIQSDLEKVVSGALKDIKCEPKIEGDAEQRIRSIIVQKAEDSYFYIECITKELAKEKTLAGVEQKLGQMPTGLDAYFRYVLNQIYERGRRPAITQILRLIAIAVRPLTIDELEEALRTLSAADRETLVKQDTQSQLALNQAVGSIHDYLDQCSPFLEVRGSSVFFANDSAKHFLFGQLDPPLDEFRIDAAESHYKAAHFCIDYIKQSPLKTRAILDPNDPIFNQWKGLRYTVIHWCEHARRSAGYAAKDLFKAAEFMIDDKSSLRTNWWQTFVSYHGADLTLHKEERKIYENMSWQEKNILRQLDKATPTPLHMNARLGLAEWVRQLLASKTKSGVNDLDIYSIPPLTWAAMENHTAVAKVLLAEGADPNALSTLQPRSAGSSFAAIRKLNSYTREALNHDALWTGNQTILYRAAFRGHVEMVQLLLDHGADVNLLGWADFSTCHAAAMSGNTEVTRLVLEKSAKNVNVALDVTLITPLHYAAEADYYEVTKALLDKGADVRMAQRTSQYNALQLAIRADTSSELIKILLESVKGYERQKLLDTRIWGDTALHMAAEKAKNSTMQVLLDFGAQIELKTVFNEDAPMMMAVRNGKKVAAEYLIEQGANIEARDLEGRTALMIAAWNGYVRNTEMLLDKKANVLATDYSGNTALHLAARNADNPSPQNSRDVIRMLIDKGSDINAKNEKNQTPLDKAANRQDAGTIALLRSYGAVLYKPNKDVKEKYSTFFDPDPEATTVNVRGSGNSLYTLRSESPPMSAANGSVDDDKAIREGTDEGESMLKNLELGDGGDTITAEPVGITKQAVVENKALPEHLPPPYMSENKV